MRRESSKPCSKLIKIVTFFFFSHLLKPLSVIVSIVGFFTLLIVDQYDKEVSIQEKTFLTTAFLSHYSPNSTQFTKLTNDLDHAIQQRDLPPITDEDDHEKEEVVLLSSSFPFKNNKCSHQEDPTRIFEKKEQILTQSSSNSLLGEAVLYDNPYIVLHELQRCKREGRKRGGEGRLDLCQVSNDPTFQTTFHIQKTLHSNGLHPAYLVDFSYFTSKDSTPLRSTNVFTILPTKRGTGVDTLILVCSVAMRQHQSSCIIMGEEEEEKKKKKNSSSSRSCLRDDLSLITLCVELAKHLQTTQWLSRDIFLLFTDKHLPYNAGIRAFLDLYTNSPGPFPRRGLIRVTTVIEQDDPVQDPFSFYLAEAAAAAATNDQPRKRTALQHAFSYQTPKQQHGMLYNGQQFKKQHISSTSTTFHQPLKSSMQILPDFDAVDGLLPNADMPFVMLDYMQAGGTLRVLMRPFWEAVYRMAVNAGTHRGHTPFLQRNIQSATILIVRRGDDTTQVIIPDYVCKLEFFMRALSNLERFLSHGWFSYFFTSPYRLISMGVLLLPLGAFFLVMAISLLPSRSLPPIQDFYLVYVGSLSATALIGSLPSYLLATNKTINDFLFGTNGERSALPVCSEWSPAKFPTYCDRARLWLGVLLICSAVSLLGCWVLGRRKQQLIEKAACEPGSDSVPTQEDYWRNTRHVCQFIASLLLITQLVLNWGLCLALSLITVPLLMCLKPWSRKQGNTLSSCLILVYLSIASYILIAMLFFPIYRYAPRPEPRAMHFPDESVEPGNHMRMVPGVSFENLNSSNYDGGYTENLWEMGRKWKVEEEHSDYWGISLWNYVDDVKKSMVEWLTNRNSLFVWVTSPNSFQAPYTYPYYYERRRTEVKPNSSTSSTTTSQARVVEGMSIGGTLLLNLYAMARDTYCVEAALFPITWFYLPFLGHALLIVGVLAPAGHVKS